VPPALVLATGMCLAAVAALRSTWSP